MILWVSESQLVPETFVTLMKLQAHSRHIKGDGLSSCNPVSVHMLQKSQLLQHAKLLNFKDFFSCVKVTGTWCDILVIRYISKILILVHGSKIWATLFREIRVRASDFQTRADMHACVYYIWRSQQIVMRSTWSSRKLVECIIFHTFFFLI
jgi:hypothetical protein